MGFPPIFASNEEASRAYMACGMAVLNWGPIELDLEGFLIILRNMTKQDTDTFPREFLRKLDEIKRLLRTDARFSGIADDLRPVLGRSKELHTIRTDVVHSICQGTNLEGFLIFGKSNQRKGIAYSETRHSILEIEAAAQEMRLLRERLEKPFQSLRALR